MNHLDILKMVHFFCQINNFNIYTIFNSQFRYSINNNIYGKNLL